MIFWVEEISKFKGPSFFAFIIDIPIMLLQNIKTSSSLVNGITATTERAILDVNI